MSQHKIPQFAAGAVYFRKTNPPPQDWERDYQTAHDDGHNVFRHWFLWGAIEVAPGVFDWSDYDRQLELGAKYGIGAIIAEHITVPEWLGDLAETPCGVNADGSRRYAQPSASCTSSYGYPCLDDPIVRERAGQFLTALAAHYKGNPGLLGYDIQNEFHYDTCYCEHTRARFARWLEKKYGSLEALAKAWHRFSLTSLGQVQIPRTNGNYPEVLDWLQYREDAFYEDVAWKIACLRAGDPDAFITGHGEASSLNHYALAGSDEWRAGEMVQLYGMTYVQERHGVESWRQLHCADITRAGSRGKPWWHAEFQGGPVWINPFSHTKLGGRPREDGRVVTPEQVRLWSFLSIMGGAKGILSPRWRSLLDGPLFGAYGFYANNGARTGRSDAFSAVAKWANAPEQAGFFGAQPAKGQVGLLVLEEGLKIKTALGQETGCDVYDKAISGAYRAFLDCGIQADFVQLSDIDRYSFLYWAYPLSVPPQIAQVLEKWVANGGCLVCQGCPAYFSTAGRAYTVQPGEGLGELFGVEEEAIEFLPDLSQEIFFDVPFAKGVQGRMYRQSYRATSGTAVGHYPDGSVCAVERAIGKGKTLLIGTFPSAACYETPMESDRAFYYGLLAWSGQTPLVQSSDGKVHLRVFENGGARWLMAVNPTSEDRETVASFPGQTAPQCGNVLWGEADGLTLKVKAMDAVVVELK